VLQFLSAVLVLALSKGVQHGCDDAAVAAVEHRLDRASTWEAIYRSIKAYPDCDDAHVGEEYSDRIVHLLATRWKEVLTLNRLAASDTQFRHFVLKHIDATTDPAELRVVVQKASHECPARATDLCKEIAAAATEAAKAAGPE